MTKLAFLDLETTGLDPDRHEIWEIGLILRYPDLADVEYLWRIEPDLTRADPTGLRIGRFYERTSTMARADKGEHYNLADWDDEASGLDQPWSDPAALAEDLARLLDGAHIVGAVPSFDAAFLSRWLPKMGQAFTAHYHLIDVEAMAVGHLIAKRHFTAPDGSDLDYSLGVLTSPPWNSNELSRALGIEPNVYERHTALGDARWVRDQYDAITSAR